MGGNLFFSFVASLVICMALIPVLAASAGRLRFIDLPNDRKVHVTPTAKIGGLAFAAGTFVATLLWAPHDPIVISSLVGAIVILLFGAWDDRAELPYQAKFLGQVLAAGIVVWFGGVGIDHLPLLPDVEMPAWTSVLISLVFIVAVTNAINLADGLDGLAGGLTLLSFTGMACLAYLAGDHIVLLMMVSILGGLLGFLRFNTYPARVFMGDAGSQFLGFYLAVTAIVLTDPLRGPYPPSLGLFLLGLPMLDTVGVMCQRLREGRLPFVADKNHLHHKLLAMGLSHRQAVLAIYSIQAGMVSLAYLLRWQHDLLVFVVYMLTAGVILTPFLHPRYRGAATGSARPSPQAEDNPLERAASMTALGQIPIRLLATVIPLFLVLSMLLPLSVSRDIGSMAGMSCVIMIGGIILVPRLTPIFIRAGLYVGSTFIMYVDQVSDSGVSQTLAAPMIMFFLLLAFLVMLTIRFNKELQFHTTPLDYLVVFLALIIPILPEMHIGDLAISILTAKLLVLYFSFELLLHLYAHRVMQLGLIALWVLVGLAIRGWWA
jgi:UDP-GlcNAc:undecaprenyl-phosphate GlcNAc-1-phosphate transferase